MPRWTLNPACFTQYAVLGISLDCRIVDRHPDTGFPLAGFALPEWERLKEIALCGTRALPGLRWQHWDIAFARDGPTALEVNLYAGGGTDVSQVSHGKGLLTRGCRNWFATPAPELTPGYSTFVALDSNSNT